MLMQQLTTQTGDLILNTNNGTNAGNVTLLDGANGNINLAPNGTGEIVVGAGDTAGDITSNGAYDLIVDTNGGTNAGNLTFKWCKWELQMNRRCSIRLRVMNRQAVQPDW